MILRTDPQRRQDFATEFRHLVGWTDPAPEEQSSLGFLFETVCDDSFPGAVLPRPRTTGIEYYAVAETGKDWRSLSPMLKAFVGPTVTDFTGLVSAMDLDDPVDRWLASWQFAAVARFGAKGDGRRETIAKAGLLRLYECHRASARPQKARPRSTRQVLDDLQMAIVAGDRQEAERALTFLRANLRLDAMNLWFLEVQLEEAFGEWDQLHQRPFFRELCRTRRPPRVTSAMVEAVYHVLIESAELRGGPTEALQEFRSDVSGSYGNLLEICPPHPRPAVAKMFLLAAVAGEQIDLRAVELLRGYASNWPEGERDSFDHMLSLIRAPTPVPPVVHRPSWADLCITLDSIRNETGPADLQRARAALLSAAVMQSLDSMRIAIEYVSRLPGAEREGLLQAPCYAGIWADIRRCAGENVVPSNWLEWLELLPKLSFEQARTYAERAVAEWPIAEHLQCPADVQALVEALDACQERGEPRLSDALPYLLAWAQGDERWPNAEFAPLYEQLLFLLLLSDRRTPNAVQALITLADAQLVLGLSEAEYVTLLRDLREVAQKLDGIRYIDSLLDVAELVAMHSCPSADARMNLWGQILATAGRFASRLTAAQVSVLNDLMGILGLHDAFATAGGAAIETEPPAHVRRADGFYVAIYTLAESVGQRLFRILTRLYPGIRVELSNDQTAGARLTSMARNADLFVICWRSAKHAATDSIRQQRPANRPTVYAPGKGSSSVLAAIEEQLPSSAA